MINNLLDADDTDDTDDTDFIILLIAQPLNPRYPCHPRLKNNIPNGANHLSLNPNHFCSFLSRKVTLTDCRSRAAELVP